MKKLLLGTMAALAMSCGNKLATSNEAHTDAAQDSTEMTATQNHGRDSYTFTTSFRKNEEEQCDALILTCKSGEKKQEFTFDFVWPKDKDVLGWQNSGEITEEDINFDGTPDVMVLLGDFGVNPGMFPSLSYAVLVWNNDTQCFDHVEKLDEVPNLEVDAKKKVIVSDYTNPIGDEFHEVYAWKNGKLELIEESKHNAFEEEEE